jgi:hypothetical protein
MELALTWMDVLVLRVYVYVPALIMLLIFAVMLISLFSDLVKYGATQFKREQPQQRRRRRTVIQRRKKEPEGEEEDGEETVISRASWCW